MKNNTNSSQMSSRLLMTSGALMTLSALLMMLCSRIAIGGCFLAAAACMFVAGYHFRLAEKKSGEDNKDV